MRVFSGVLAATSLVLAAASPAAAQETFADLQRTLKPGQTVFVIDAAGRETRGTVQGVERSALRLDVDGIEREWAAMDVREVRRRDSLKNGTIIGVIAGGALGAVGGWAIGSIFESEGASFGRPFVTITALGAGIGAGIGAGVDALIPGRSVVYRQSRAVAVAPIISPTSQGVGISVRF